jgi:hypothetical protein
MLLPSLVPFWPRPLDLSIEFIEIMVGHSVVVEPSDPGLGSAGTAAYTKTGTTALIPVTRRTFCSFIYYTFKAGTSAELRGGLRGGFDKIIGIKAFVRFV